LDGFDPAAPALPVSQRPDLDRWILSDLQKLIETARAAFESYDLPRLCLEAERFVDDKLSNWYIRRNRRRFWKGERGSDKLAAYQTLYTVLTTFTKLVAPIMPFLSEAMWQNLVGAGSVSEGDGSSSLALPSRTSVHLCEYPAIDASLIDEQLSA